MKSSSIDQNSLGSEAPIYTMPEKFLPKDNTKQGKAGKGIIIFLYFLIAVVIIAGGMAIWYFFIYNQGQTEPDLVDANNGANVAIDNKNAPVKPDKPEPVKEDLPGVEIKFVAKDQDTRQEVSSLLIKLDGADASLADSLQVASLLPAQATGRARQAIGAIYTIKSTEPNLKFSKPTTFVFSYVEPDDLTTKKENSLRLFQEVAGGWVEQTGATLDIVKNEITIVWQSLPTGRIAILSNLVEEFAQPEQEPPPEDSSFANINPLTISLDSDNDGLSEQEEFLYQSDKNMPDSDSDGYVDGVEVMNGYSPASTSTLLADNLVKEFVDGELGFKVNYPSSWTVTLPKTLGEQRVIFESLQDDFIQISVQDNESGQTALEWYANLLPDLDSSQLTIETVGDYTGVVSQDNANFYLAVGNKIYIFTYSTGLKTKVDYLTTFKMLYKSFRLQS